MIFEAPEKLWHYTSLSSLIAIWESRQLLASDFRFLNDRSEWMHALTLLEKWRSQSRKPAARALSSYDKLISRHKSNVNSPFVISFSKNDDDLSMWRAYGNIQNGGEAVAIGFSYDDLRSLTDQWEFQGPSPCNYEESDIINLFEREINVDVLGEADGSALFSLLVHAPYTKNERFRHEDEWRIVTSHPNDPLTMSQRLVALGNSYRLPLPLTGETKHVNCISDICVGPTTSFEKVAAFIEYAQMRHAANGGIDIPRINLSNSKAPFAL